MKSVVSLLIILNFCCCCNSPELHDDKLFLQDGLYYYLDENQSATLFTGTSFLTFSGGRISNRYPFKSGIPVGESKVYLHTGDILSTTKYQLINLENKVKHGIVRVNLSAFHEEGPSEIIYRSLNVITSHYIEDKAVIIEALKDLPILMEFEKVDIDCKLGEFEDPYLNLTWYEGIIQ